MSFVTIDNPDTVLQWYREQLEQQHWRPNIDIPEAHLINYMAAGPSVLVIMEVNAEPVDEHTTRVVVVMQPEPPA